MTKNKFSLKNFSFNNLFNPRKQGNDWFYPISSSGTVFGGVDNLKEFCEIPELNSIINIRARAMASWNLQIVSKQTGLEAKNNESLVRILKTPNWFQGQSEFWRQSDLWRDIYGNEFLYFLTPLGMPNNYKAMFTLDSSRVKINYKGSEAYFTEPTGENIQYTYTLLNGREIPLDIKDIIHLNDNRVKASGLANQSSNFLYGTSKMNSQIAAINNIRAAYEKRGIVLKMPVGIMSNSQDDAIGQSVPMDPEEKKKVQMRIRTRGAWPVITNLATKYNAMNVNSQTMGLFEEVREDTAKLCDAYGVPYEMLASQKGVTFSNLKEAKKQFYEETIIPDAKEKVDALNLHLDTENKAWEVKADFSHLPVFAEDVKARASTIAILVTALDKALASEAITLDQYKIELQKFGI